MGEKYRESWSKISLSQKLEGVVGQNESSIE